MDNNQQNISTPLLIFNAAIVALIITMFFAIYEVLHKPVTNKLPSQAQSQRFTQLSLEAKAVYVFDVVKNRIIWKKNETAHSERLSFWGIKDIIVFMWFLKQSHLLF